MENIELIDIKGNLKEIRIYGKVEFWKEFIKKLTDLLETDHPIEISFENTSYQTPSLKNMHYQNLSVVHPSSLEIENMIETPITKQPMRSTSLKSLSVVTWSETTYCRVCGYDLNEPPWGVTGDSPMFIICPCCGCESGLEDQTIEDMKQYRAQWISSGASWYEKKSKPKHWSLDEQMQNIPEKYKEEHS